MQAAAAAATEAAEAAAEDRGGRDKNNTTPRSLLSPSVGLILGPYLVAPPLVLLGGRFHSSQMSNLPIMNLHLWLSDSAVQISH